MNEKLTLFLNERQIPHRTGVFLKYETYLKKGGRANYLIEPNNVDKFISVLEFLFKNKLPYKVIGLTSNLYFLDELEYDIIISTKSLKSIRVDTDANVINVDSGYSLEEFVRVVLIQNGIGFEGLEGVPASIGGALFMNASAYGYSISDHLLAVTVIDDNANIHTLNNSECEFSDKSSLFKRNKGYTILSAKFSFNNGDQKSSADKIRKFHIARHTYQEFSYPNLGSLYSTQGDIYREISRDSFYFKIYIFILKVLFKNPISKFLFRKNPHNRVFNKIIIRFFGKTSFDIAISDKSLNILINNGASDYQTIKKHINLLGSHLKEQTLLENEIVLSPLAKSMHNKDIIKGGLI